MLDADTVRAQRRDRADGGASEWSGPLRELLETCVDAVYVADTEGRFLYANPVAASMFGARPADVVGHTAHELLAADLADRIIRADRQAMATPDEAHESESVIDPGHGWSTRWAWRSEGVVRGVFCIIRPDAAVRRTALAMEHARLCREIEKASRARSDFLATMSHELRTPLNAISGYTDLLQLGVPDPVQRQAHLERIKASTWHLLSVIEGILSFSRLEAGREEVRVQSVDAVHIAQEAATLVRAAAVQKGLRFEHDLPDHAVRTETDRMKLRQILMNLLANAVKFTDRGTVSLTLKATRDRVLFHVRDTGRGIRAEELDLIFEPFWQAEPAITRSVGGTGIGLTVARQLADLLRGRITVDSVPGRGSAFTLELPRRIET